MEICVRKLIWQVQMNDLYLFKKIMDLEKANNHPLYKNHKIKDTYTMDGKSDPWEIVYYPIFEDGKTREVYEEPRALVQNMNKPGFWSKEVPLRYLKPTKKVKMQPELTIKEALEEGYTHCGRPNKSWQALTSIKDLTDIDFEDGEEWVLAEKEGTCHTVDESGIAELLADSISYEDSENTGRDDEEVYNTLKTLDYKPTVDMINKALEPYKSWKLTDIKLKPNNKW